MASGEKECVDFELFHPKDSRRHQVVRFNLGIGSERALYTVLPEEICQYLGEPLGTFIQFIDAEGTPSEVELWAVGVRYKDRQRMTVVIPSRNGKTIMGFLTLAQLGLTFNLTPIRCFEDQLFNSLIYDYAYDVIESLYNTREALDVYREVVRQFNEDWIDIYINNRGYLLNEWKKSSFVVWFITMYQYSLNAAIILLLVGLYPYIAIAYRQSLESLVAAYVADTHKNYTEISDPLVRLDIVFEELEKTGFKNIVDKYFGDDKDLANEISSLWKELSKLFVHARGLLHTFPELSSIASSIAMGLPLMAYVDGDKEPLSLLNNCIRRFRKVFKILFDKWSIA
jgi:hypothetical protein